jgi:RHS repeat-associated protein
MLRLWQNMEAPDLGELVQGPLDALVQSTVRNDHALVLVDDDLLRMVAEPVEYVRLWTTAERLKIVELPGTTPMMVLSAPGGIPAPGVPTNGPLPPPVWDGNPQIPVPLGTGPEKPWWMYQVDPEGDVYDPLKDVDRAGGGGPGENFLFGEYRFVPRAYLMRGDVARGLVSETSENASDFERSLQALLNNGSADECVTTASCLYPPHVSFNTYFADVNGDGLPDLISAEPPRPSPALTCFNGHRVHLNRGYAFEDAPFQTLPSEKASWTPADATSALQLVANRDRSCEVTKPRIVDDPLSVPPIGAPPAFPVGAMTQTDINGDGRVDIVLAYKAITAANADQRVFLNNGRGFAPSSALPFPPTLPATVAIATDMPFPGQTAFGGWPRVALGDQARFVDLDNDGLVDIVVAGLCTNGNVYFPRNCTPTVWYRNEGTLPDRLERIESPTTAGGGIAAGTGAWTTIEYESPKSSVVHIPDGGFHPPATMRVVTKVRSGAGPEATPSGSDPFAVQEIRLSYDNFVKDVVSNEVLGFEKVIAEFVNSFDAAERERVLVTRIFDVQPEIVGAGGSPLPVRHPLKGALLSTVTESGGWSTTELYQYQVDLLGSGVRIRSRRELHGDTSPSQSTAWTGEETREFDSFGNATWRVAGNLDGETIGPAEQRRTTGLEYENHTDAQWMIGLVTRVQKQGYSVDIDGNVDPDHVLEDVVNTYDSLGATVSTARVNIIDAACAGPADDVKRFDYWPNGLLKASHESAGPAGGFSRDVNFTYDAKGLYVTTAQTSVGKMSGLSFLPATTSLTVSFQTDLRHGKTTRVTDPNNAATVSVYDSRGRLLTRTGPDSTLLEQNVYNDVFPLAETSTITTDVGKTFQRRTQLDADGHALSIVEGAGTTAVPWSRTSKVRVDAFGRTVQSFLPAFVSAIGAGVTPSTGPKEVTSYDGFDRAVQVIGADGRVTSTAYEPRETIETNARGIVTHRTYDAFGELLAVDRNPGGAPNEHSTHSFVRDGRGEIVSVTDGDGSVRRLQRDGGGRIRFITLPTAAGQTPTRFGMCHDVGDKLVHLESPAGRVVDLMHDELGRTLVSTATDSSGLSIRNTEIYDQGVPGGFGRLTRKNDESGSYRFEYDAYGRPSTLTYVPSTRAIAGATNVAATYGATFVYTPAGALTTVSFTGVPGASSAPGITYTRDVKGRATTVKSKQGSILTPLATSVTFDAADRITSAFYGNGTSGAWTFNPLSERLDKISYLNSSNGVVASVAHVYDENDNPIQEDRQKQGYSGIYSQKIHRYDALDRLYSSEEAFPTGNQYERYAYSPSGNVMTAGADAYTYASPVTAQAVSLLVNSAANKQRTLGYDEDGYLESDVENRGDGTRTTKTLAFDPFGCMRSITKVDRAANGTTSSAASDYTCGLDGRVVARSTVKADTTKSRRIDFAGLAEVRPDDGVFLLRVPLQGSVAVEDARSLSTGARVSASSGYIISDARGSVLARTRFDVGTPSFTTEAEYDAWGKKLAGYSTLSSPKHGFAGAELDEAAGTYSFGARTYDPTLRRWVSPDPLLAGRPDIDEAVGPSLNLYAYADGNPVKNTDKSGFCPTCEGIALGATVGGVIGALKFAVTTPNLSPGAFALGAARAFSTGAWNGAAEAAKLLVAEATAVKTVGVVVRALSTEAVAAKSVATAAEPAAAKAVAPAAEPAAAKAAAPSSPKDPQLVRFGKGPETAEQLATDAARAESAGLPHGVSTKQVGRVSGTDNAHRAAPKSEVEKHFTVQQTGKNPAHQTVHLP